MEKLWPWTSAAAPASRNCKIVEPSRRPIVYYIFDVLRRKRRDTLDLA
jgi:hypothetical protein